MTYLTPAEFAKRLNVATVTVRKWAQKGMLNSILTPGGHRRYTFEELARFATKHNIPYNGEDSNKLRLLVVDDDEQMRRYLVTRFNANASDIIETDHAEDGFDAGHKLHTFKPNVVLLDLMMPGIDGFDVCQSIKDCVMTKHIRVIAMTGFYETETVNRIINVGAEACIPKPIDFDALLALIDVKVSRTAGVRSS